VLFEEIMVYTAVKEAEEDVALKNEMETTLKQSVYELIQPADDPVHEPSQQP
jgi:hypothetical protein